MEKLVLAISFYFILLSPVRVYRSNGSRNAPGGRQRIRIVCYTTNETTITRIVGPIDRHHSPLHSLHSTNESSRRETVRF